MNRGRAAAALLICAVIAYGFYRVYLHASHLQPAVVTPRMNAREAVAPSLLGHVKRLLRDEAINGTPTHGEKLIALTFDDGPYPVFTPLLLDELNALGKPRIEVLNKIDLLDSHEREGMGSRLLAAREVGVSARTGEGMDSLIEAIDQALFSDPVIEAQLDIPQKEGAALAAIEAGMVIRDRSYEGNVVHLTVAGPASLVGRFRTYKSRD